MPPLEAGLAVSESGDQGGPPLLLLHGIGGLGAMWAPATSHLAEFRCLTPDLPGHGGSRGTAWRSFTDSAAAVEALITTQSPDTPVHLAGLSLGGYVALHIAARGRVPLGRVLVSGVPFSPLPRQTLMRVMAYLMLPFIRSERMARANMKAMRITDAASVSAAIAGMKAVGRRSFLRANLDAVAHTPPAGLQAAGPILLMLAGTREHPLIRNDLATPGRWVPGAEAALVPGLGHGWPGEDPQLFAEVARAWCAHGEVHPRLDGPA